MDFKRVKEIRDTAQTTGISAETALVLIRELCDAILTYPKFCSDCRQKSDKRFCHYGLFMAPNKKKCVYKTREEDMDTRTGRLLDANQIAEAEKQYFKPVKRDLTVKEKADLQIKLYSPCGCGSGKKFKFCCYHHSGV